MEVFPTLLGQKPPILFTMMTYFLADTVTKYKKLGSLEQQKGIAAEFWILENQSAGPAGQASLNAVQRLSSPLPSGPALPADPGPSATSRQAPPASSHGLPSVCVS